MVLEDKILAMAEFQWSSGFVPPPRVVFSWPIKHTISINGAHCNINKPLLLIEKKDFSFFTSVAHIL